MEKINRSKFSDLGRNFFFRNNFPDKKGFPTYNVYRKRIQLLYEMRAYLLVFDPHSERCNTNTNFTLISNDIRNFYELRSFFFSAVWIGYAKFQKLYDRSLNTMRKIEKLKKKVRLLVEWVMEQDSIIFTKIILIRMASDTNLIRSLQN